MLMIWLEIKYMLKLIKIKINWIQGLYHLFYLAIKQYVLDMLEFLKLYLKNLEFIQSFPAFQTNGQFDEQKFQQSYLAAADGFQKLSQKDFAQSIASSLAYYKGNFLAPKEQRIYEPEFQITNEAYNPQKQKISVWGLNTYSAPTMSEREIAQSNFVYDINTNSWEESPNKQGFFGNIKTQKVLAQWDFNADINGNPTEDESKIVYRKGQHKLNYKNQPYYENLDGRSTYGREVLSAWNTITTDNSVSNKFDFFDSDDLEKSTSSTLLKNIVKVAPAFIPGIAPWYIAARVGLEMTDLLSRQLKCQHYFLLIMRRYLLQKVFQKH